MVRIKLCEAIKLYEADGMEKGKEIEDFAIKERKEFLSTYPIELIPNLTIEQYASGDKSFGHWLLYGLPNITSPGNVFPDAAGVYTAQEDNFPKKRLSKTYKKLFDSDYENAFICLKNEIVNFLEDIKQKNYNNFDNYKINSIMKNMLMIVYFDDKFVPVRIERKT